jgi:plastocyanin
MTTLTRPLAAASMVLALAACGSDDAGDTAAPADGTGGGEDAVSIVDNDYEPADLEVAVGETVSWTNDGDVDHTVTFDDEDSGNLAPGDDYDRTFDEAGEFDYACTIHATMVATVTVTD